MGKPNQYGRNFGYKYSHFGQNLCGHDVKAFGDTTGKCMFWDASADTLYVVGTLSLDGTFNADNIALADTETLTFGTGNDVVIQWDGTNLILDATADDSLIEIGDSAATQKSFDLKWYGNEANGASFLYADASANLIYTTDIDLQFKDNDLLVFGTGAGATGDVNIKWDATNLVMAGTAANTSWVIGATGNYINPTLKGVLTVGADTDGFDVKFYGATTGKYFTWDQSEDTAIVSGVIQLGATVTAALAIGGGTSATKLTTAVADKNFGGMFTESTATSGDSRGLYWRHYLGGTIAATGFGDAVRAFCTVTGTGYSYASGLHATMQINAGATVTGSGAGARATLAAAAEARTLVGSLAALQVDSDIGVGNTVPARCSLIRLDKAGSVDVPFALDIADDQCLQGAAAAGAGLNALKVILPDGTTGYINIIALS
jgi:hypothetical protein